MVGRVGKRDRRPSQGGMVGGVEREGVDRAAFGITVTYYLELRYFL